MTLAESNITSVAIIGKGSIAAGIADLLGKTSATVALIEPSLFAIAGASECLERADWIVDASGRAPMDKQVIFRAADAVRKDGSLVSTDESVAQLAELTYGLEPRFCRSFAITHFFAPLEHLPLVELVFGSETAPREQARFASLCSGLLGRTLLRCQDRPGFIANRIGLFWIAMASIEAIEHGLSVTNADTIAHRFFRNPRSGIFGVSDFIGIDLVVDLVRSLGQRLPTSDAIQAYRLEGHPIYSRLIDRLQTGVATGGGFYRKPRRAGPREVLDFQDLEYRAPSDQDRKFPDTLSAMCEQPDKFGRYARTIREKLDQYTLAVCTEHAISVDEADMALRLGYGWSAR